jgi:type I restriction enzyme R subunit
MADAQITAGNLSYCGEPVYGYDMSQGSEDGYLAACEILQRDIFLDRTLPREQETGGERTDLEDKTLGDAITVEIRGTSAAREVYGTESFEDRLFLPERVAFA